MSIAWLWKRILHVDLDHRKHEIVNIDDIVYKLILSGRGLAIYLLHRYGPRGVSPLDPKNPLIIAPGLFVGSGIPTGSKTIIAAKSPLTGFAGRASVGAWLGYNLRRAGFDAMVITGSITEPSVIVVDDESISIEDAKDLWGLTVGETRRKLKQRYGPGYADCIIGPAGEKLSKIACIDCNGRQAGRTGLGAIMGSKNIKAIIVKGAKDLKPYDEEKTKELVKKWSTGILEHPSSKGIMNYGTPAMVKFTGEIYGVLPSLNWKKSTLEWCPDAKEAVKRLAYWAPDKRIGRNPCPYCNRPCSSIIKVRYKDKEVEVDGPEYETVYALGTNLGFCDVEPIAILNYFADEYGLDTISLGGTLGWLLEALERGILTKDDVDGLEPKWGDLEGLVEAIRKIALREGKLGELLADGVKEAVEKIGGRGIEFAIHVKGLTLPAYDARGLKGMGLGYAVSTRGGDHLTSAAYAVEVPKMLWVYRDVDAREYKGKGILIKELEDLMALFDITGLCKFSRHVFGPGEQAEIINALTGLDISEGEALHIGERTVNLEHLFNLHEGLEPVRDDILPQRILKEPITDGPSKGLVLSLEELESMKREYYAARGWNPYTGRPSKAKLISLDIHRLIDIDKYPIDTTI